MPEIASLAPLTKLSEEEELFRDTVRGFAERDIRPRVAAMEKAAAMDPALLAKCFELGLMGIEIPEQHGGAGGSLDRKSTRLNSSHLVISYAVFCLKKKKK